MLPGSKRPTCRPLCCEGLSQCCHCVLSLAFHLGSDFEPTIWSSRWFGWVANASEQLWVQYRTHVICYFMWVRRRTRRLIVNTKNLLRRRLGEAIIRSLLTSYYLQHLTHTHAHIHIYIYIKVYIVYTTNQHNQLHFFAEISHLCRTA